MIRESLTSKGHRRPNGFSMVEFLVAAFIMAIGLLGLTLLQTASLSQAANGRHRATAVHIANWILQRAQVEGQSSYFAKLNSLTLPTTAVFTASTVTEGDLNTFGGFNVDGIQIEDGTLTKFSDAILNVQVPDTNKRGRVFTASWSRRAYGGTAPPAGGAQAQEFVVNINWTEGQGVAKYLTLSRIIRY